jgi:hypothetical protein
MTTLTRAARALGFALTLGLVAAGCNSGPKVVDLKGKLTQGGQPIQLTSKTATVELVFVPEVSEGTHFTTYIGNVSDDGSYECARVPTGKYKVAVYLRDPSPQFDKFNGKFSDKKTTVTKEVTGNVNEQKVEIIDIDLPK